MGWAGLAHARRICITVLAANAKDLASPDVPGIDDTGRNGETATAAAGAAAGAGAEAVIAVTTTPPSRCAVEPAIGCHSCCAAMQGRRARRDTSTCMKAGGYTLEKREMPYIDKSNTPRSQLTHYLSR